MQRVSLRLLAPLCRVGLSLLPVRVCVSHCLLACSLSSGSRVVGSTRFKCGSLRCAQANLGRQAGAMHNTAQAMLTPPELAKLGAVRQTAVPLLRDVLAC